MRHRSARRPRITPPSGANWMSCCPASGDVRTRLVARDEHLTVPADRLPAVLDWLADELRRRSDAVFSAPEGESLTISIVTGQPWSAYNWYDGNLRSRIEVNTDLPVRAHQVIGTMAHETFPGHHLEHASKEARLVREQGRARVVDPADQHSRGVHQRGTCRARPALRGRRRRLAVAADRAVRQRRPADDRRRRGPRVADHARSFGRCAAVAAMPRC